MLKLLVLAVFLSLEINDISANRVVYYDTDVPQLPLGDSRPDYPNHPKILPNHDAGQPPCHCKDKSLEVPKRNDYQYTPGIGAHKLHTKIQTFNEARKICNKEGGHLAVINSPAEAKILMDMFQKAAPIRGTVETKVAIIGTHNMFNAKEWVTILGDPLEKTGYTKWSKEIWGQQPDNTRHDQRCGGLARDGMDDVFCSHKYAFFCEIPAV